MKLLLDTHYLLWAAIQPERLRVPARELILDESNHLWFSAASIWEVAIKRTLNRPSFRVDAVALRAGLLANGYQELAVEGRHVVGLTTLPGLHNDPFDRILISQAASEGLRLLSDDAKVIAYGGPVLSV